MMSMKLFTVSNRNVNGLIEYIIQTREIYMYKLYARAVFVVMLTSYGRVV
jgi:hypothetical protein